LNCFARKQFPSSSSAL